jgi:hypothetical protein
LPPVKLIIQAIQYGFATEPEKVPVTVKLPPTVTSPVVVKAGAVTVPVKVGEAVLALLLKVVCKLVPFSVI